ncbi:MAG: MgtC/SapB family protein [Bryobacteraceae bacterium]
MLPGEPWIGMAVALLIGLLVGLQREMVQQPSRAGLRDFLIASLTGGVCALVGDPLFTASILVVLVAVTLVCSWRGLTPESGMTTELALVAVFSLAFAAAYPPLAVSRPVVVSLAIVLAAALEAKRALDRFVHETITAQEFSDTIRFLAAIFVIYPILPRGAYGPYEFFEPRLVWLFVILVSSISFAGYFLRKFLGAAQGLRLTAALGALTSTTAVTAALASESREHPGHTRTYAAAAALANAIQFPRVWAIVAVVSPGLAARTWLPFATACLAGLVIYAVWSRDSPEPEAIGFAADNPFRLGPALKFGAAFSAILLLMKWTNATWGGAASSWSGALAGTLDVDSVAVSLSRMAVGGAVAETLAWWGIFTAMASNAVAKTAIAGSASRALGVRAGLAMGIMLAVAAGTWALAPHLA